MEWIFPFLIINLIGIGANLDNIAVGMAYGVKEVRIPHWINVLINTIGFLTALFGAYAGTIINGYLSLVEANLISSIVLCLIGLCILYSAYIQPLFSRQKKIELNKITYWHGILLGFTLSITNIASGFSVTVSNTTTLWVTAITIAIWGYLLIWLGNILGIGIISQLLGKYSSLIAGILLIGVGLGQIL